MAPKFVPLASVSHKLSLVLCVLVVGFTIIILNSQVTSPDVNSSHTHAMVATAGASSSQPHPKVAPLMVGHIEHANVKLVSGWLCVANAPAQSLLIQLVANGRPCGDARLAGFREDIIKGYPKECHGVTQNTFTIEPSCQCAGGDRGYLKVWILTDQPQVMEFSDINAVRYFTIGAAEPEVNAGSMAKKSPAPLWSHIIGHFASIPFTVDATVPVRLNIMMCDLQNELTGGPLSIIHFAVLAAKSGIRVRYIDIEGRGIRPHALFKRLQRYDGLQDFGRLVEYVPTPFNLRQNLRFNPGDLCMGTIFYAAIMAAQIQAKLRNPNIIYFIQDYEPIFFPHNADYLEAVESYLVPHFPIFSTPFLRTYFIKNRIGLYRCHPAPNDEGTTGLDWAAQPAIRRHAPMDVNYTPTKRTLFAYARKQAARNAYDYVLAVLNLAVTQGIFDGDQWQFIGVGAMQSEDVCGFGGRQDVCLQVKAYITEPEYLQLLHDGDIALSLMVSPHPSLPPLDFAAAGMVVVTNSFATKDQEGFANVSSNFIVTPPTIAGIVDGLRRAVVLSKDRVARKKGSALNWAEKWDDDRCYGPKLFSMVKRWFNYTENLNQC